MPVQRRPERARPEPHDFSYLEDAQWWLLERGVDFEAMWCSTLCAGGDGSGPSGELHPGARLRARGAQTDDRRGVPEAAGPGRGRWAPEPLTAVEEHAVRMAEPVAA